MTGQPLGGAVAEYNGDAGCRFWRSQPDLPKPQLE